MRRRSRSSAIRSSLSSHDPRILGPPKRRSAVANLESEENPFLQGNFAPVKQELDTPALEVIGEIPRDLRGTYYRNGPNQAFEPIGRYHWFDGDGMIHAIRLEDGRASYRNRWVESDGLKEEREAGKALYPGLLEIKPTEAP